MATVGIVMGSDSDLPIMSQAAKVLDEFGISYEMDIISAHREPNEFFEYASSEEERGYKVIIPQGANSTFDNDYMTGEVTYKYYNEMMWP